MMPYLSIKNCGIIHKNKTSQHKLVCSYFNYIDYVLVFLFDRQNDDDDDDDVNDRERWFHHPKMMFDQRKFFSCPQ